jgi:membrane protease subunit HflK
MARTDGSEERKVGRLLTRLLLVVLLLGGAGAWWAVAGWFVLNPGEVAVILRFGEYARTVTTEGFHLKVVPGPVETQEIVNVSISQRREFGDVDATDPVVLAETAMQTSDNNIVHVEFMVQYKVGKAFESRYRVADLEEILRDSAQAAMREVIGRNTIDGVLTEMRGAIGLEAAELLQEILDSYDSGLFVGSVELQNVQPPESVRDAFDDVIAANQDRNRTVNEAEGYANEVLPRSRAEANEALQGAIAYREAKIAEAGGEAQRFLAIVGEYQRAPEITRKRLYLETMEEVLPDVEKVIIEPGTATVLPYLPLGAARGGAD